MKKTTVLIWIGLLLCLLAGCAGPAAPAGGGQVLAVETFLADIAQNVAGSRLVVTALIPLGVDPHAFEPAPADIVRLGAARLIIANGAGFESWLARTIANAGAKAVLMEASAGLAARTPGAGELLDPAEREMDPHFWLDPTKVIRYVENIRDALSLFDPPGKAEYAANAAAYIARLNDLDAWIQAELAGIPPERRLLVTNHESFGYFADRYGLRVVGTIVPSVSTEASPSAQQLARLVDSIRSTKAPAVFLETGTNPQLADQLARETGVKVVTGLYTHSITPADGPAPSYIEMMNFNAAAIAAALK